MKGDKSRMSPLEYLIWLGLATLTLFVCTLFGVMLYTFLNSDSKKDPLKCTRCDQPVVRIDMGIDEPVLYFHTGGLVHRKQDNDGEGIQTTRRV